MDDRAHAQCRRGVGEAPTPESIRQGTVRMELHPDFPEVVRFLDEQGFRLVEHPKVPNVMVRHVYSADRTVLLRQKREVGYREGMRFLDLDHEIHHVHQLKDRFNWELGTEAVRELPNGKFGEMNGTQRICRQGTTRSSSTTCAFRKRSASSSAAWTPP